ncbi:MAG: cobaltochelatase subunit CobN [Bilophila wadsworthia]
MRSATAFRAGQTRCGISDEGIRLIGKTVPVVCVSYDPAAWALSSVPVETAQTAYRYLTYGGAENLGNLFRFLDALPNAAAVPEPVPVPWEGLWHPDAPVRAFATVRGYLEWYAGYACERGLSLDPERTVGLLFGRHYWVNDMPDVEAALVHALEAKGLGVFPAFTNTLRDKATGNKGATIWSREVFLGESGSRIGALVKFLPYFTNNGGNMPAFVGDDSPARESVCVFRELGVPIFQPVFASSKTLEEWEADPQGLNSEVSWAVAMPEFEGAIEPFFLGGGTCPPGWRGRNRNSAVRPIPNGWSVSPPASPAGCVSNKPVAERRVAFLLNSDPCASVEASVGGAAKLDSLESVSRILRAMRQAGYAVDVPESGAALIETIMERKAISEFRWTTVQEIEAKGGVLAHVDLATYRRWFDAYPENVRQKVAEAWGNPPGEPMNGVPAAMVLNGDILVTGVRWGNAVVCIQPKRGCAGSRCDGQVCKILHDPSVPPPHQYIATYRWLQDGFGADVVVHVGTHGNLEFLPGKSVGLSGACFPDLALHEVPHAAISTTPTILRKVLSPSGGSYAELVDHMQTVMVQSGLYDALEELDRLFGEWEQARAGNPNRAHQLEHLIREGIAAANLEAQVSLETSPDFATLASRIHAALGLLRNTHMEDGMHVFGETPQGKRRAQFIASIVRYDAGQADSLRKRLCKAQGFELETLLAEPGRVDKRLRQSHASLLEKVENSLLPYVKY